MAMHFKAGDLICFNDKVGDHTIYKVIEVWDNNVPKVISVFGYLENNVFNYAKKQYEYSSNEPTEWEGMGWIFAELPESHKYVNHKHYNVICKVMAMQNRRKELGYAF